MSADWPVETADRPVKTAAVGWPDETADWPDETAGVGFAALEAAVFAAKAASSWSTLSLRGGESSIVGILLGRDIVVHVVQQSLVPLHFSFEGSETAPVTWGPWVVVALSSSGWLCYDGRWDRRCCSVG